MLNLGVKFERKCNFVFKTKDVLVFWMKFYVLCIVRPLVRESECNTSKLEERPDQNWSSVRGLKLHMMNHDEL